jgi:hypothetical protein
VTDEDEAAAALARRAVAETAPEELPLFRATSQAYFDDPERALSARGGRDEMLGFGVEAAVVLVTPVALDVAKTVVAFVVARVRAIVEREAGAVIDRTAEGVLARFRGGGEPAGEAAPELSKQQLAEVRQLAYERALALDLPDAKAGLLADALVGSLT